MLSPLGADLLRHQVPHTEQLLVLLRSVWQRDLDNTEGEAKWISTAKGAVTIIQHNAAIRRRTR
jgi:hypothetical protein